MDSDVKKRRLEKPLDEPEVEELLRTLGSVFDDPGILADGPCWTSMATWNYQAATAMKELTMKGSADYGSPDFLKATAKYLRLVADKIEHDGLLLEWQAKTMGGRRVTDKGKATRLKRPLVPVKRFRGRPPSSIKTPVVNMIQSLRLHEPRWEDDEIDALIDALGKRLRHEDFSEAAAKPILAYVKQEAYRKQDATDPSGTQSATLEPHFVRLPGRHVVAVKEWMLAEASAARKP